MSGIKAQISGDLRNISASLKKFKQVASHGAEIGWVKGTPKKFVLRAHSMEFRHTRDQDIYEEWAVIRKLRLAAMTDITQRVRSIAAQTVSGKSIWNKVGAHYETALKESINALVFPPLKDLTFPEGSPFRGGTVPRKRSIKLGRGVSPTTIFKESTETFEAISHRVIDRNGDAA